MSSPHAHSLSYAEQLRAVGARHARDTAALMWRLADVRDAVAASYRRMAASSPQARAARYADRAEDLELLAERARSYGAWERASADCWDGGGTPPRPGC